MLFERVVYGTLEILASYWGGLDQFTRDHFVKSLPVAKGHDGEDVVIPLYKILAFIAEKLGKEEREVPLSSRAAICSFWEAIAVVICCTANIWMIDTVFGRFNLRVDFCDRIWIYWERMATMAGLKVVCGERF